MKFKVQKIKLIPVLISFMVLSSMFILRAQRDVFSENLPILVNLSHMGFGDVYPGQEAQKTFEVSYSGSGDGKYTIEEKYKPKPGATVPCGYKGSISDYCQENHDDFERCYRNLCPYIDVFSSEGENDTTDNASVSATDPKDVWTVDLKTPAIAGKVSQDYKGNWVSETGEYGCDLSFNIGLPSAPVCGNGKVESGEECDDGNKFDNDECLSTCKINKGSISGCKYNDRNNDGEIQCGKEEKMSHWKIQLVQCLNKPLPIGTTSFIKKITTNSIPGIAEGCSVINETETGDGGCYTFPGLIAGDYGITEVNQSGWTQTYPANDSYYYINLAAGEDRDGINFLNHQEEAKPLPVCGNGIKEDGEECDDGNKNDGDTCSSTCKNISNGGGGGGGVIHLRITNEKVIDVTEDSAKFTWLTNKRADSRVICGETSVLGAKLEKKPDYGYEFSSSTFDVNPTVASHSISVFELKPDTQYFCRTVSSTKSEEVISSELSFKTPVYVVPPIVPPVVPPVVAPEAKNLYIYNLTLKGLKTNTASLNWKTNANGTTCLVYSKAAKSLGEKPKYGYDWNTAGCWDLSKQGIDHSTTVAGLEPCTTYYFRLTSTDGSLDAVTDEQKVKTLCQTPSTYYPRKYVPSISASTATPEELGQVEAAQAEQKPECPVCDNSKGQETIKTVIEKERYMSCEDWFILLLILIIMTLLINALRNRNGRRQEEGLAGMAGGRNEESEESFSDNPVVEEEEKPIIEDENKEIKDEPQDKLPE